MTMVILEHLNAVNHLMNRKKMSGTRISRAINSLVVPLMDTVSSMVSWGPILHILCTFQWSTERNVASTGMVLGDHYC